MNPRKSHFVFNRSQQNGIFLLVVIIVLLQLFYFYNNFKTHHPQVENDHIDILYFQQKIDSIKLATAKADTVRIYPFNPNFVTDFRGYTLGMSTEEIDRLHAYREQDKWVNSKEEFQKVTGVTDSLLNHISQYFRFPEWVTRNNTNAGARDARFEIASGNTEKRDLNSATLEDLKEVKGIGEILAGRIVNYRAKIGGFVHDIQLKDIYGLNFETRNELEKHFTVKAVPVIEKININKAGVLDLTAVPYINYELAREIVNFRLLHEEISSFEELAKIKEFPSEKIDRIALYLTLE